MNHTYTLRGGYYRYSRDESLMISRPNVEPPQLRTHVRTDYLGFRTFRQLREPVRVRL